MNKRANYHHTIYQITDETEDSVQLYRKNEDPIWVNKNSKFLVITSDLYEEETPQEKALRERKIAKFNKKSK